MNKKYQIGKQYNDLGCKNGQCYSSFEANTQSLFKQYFEKSNNYVFMVRDYSLLEIIKKKNYKYLSERLAELNYMIEFFYQKAEKDEDLLVIVSSAESIPMELPNQGGKYWSNAINTFKFSSFKKPSLMSPILVKGAGSEKFCGIFDATEIIKKLY